MECLNEIIGIIEAECACITEGLDPQEILALKVSKSGLYLDDVEGGISLRALQGLDSCRNLAEMSFKARSAAAKKIYADLLAAISKKYNTGKAAYVGGVGRPSYTGNLNVSSRYQYVKLTPKELSDAVIKVTGIRLILDSAITTTVKIFSVLEGDNQGTEVFSAEVTTIANVYSPVTVPALGLSLPLRLNNQNLEYYVVWDRGLAGTVKPKDLKLTCNCPSGIGYEPFFDAKGGELNDLDALQGGNTSKYAQGILIDVDVRCVPGNLICREYDRENAIAVTMAWCMLYKTQELLIEAILGSQEINRYTMMNREALYGKRAHFRKEYEGRIPYLASVIDVGSSDCYICRDSQMFFQGILS
jgi:hypothetical protein